MSEPILNEHAVMLAASKEFESYAGGSVFCQPISQLQADLAAWQNRNFGAQAGPLLALGVSEEVGELCHAILKGEQAIRGYADPALVRAKVADAGADAVIYLMQLLTVYRLDFGVVLRETARRVMAREWTKDPVSGGEAP